MYKSLQSVDLETNVMCCIVYTQFSCELFSFVTTSSWNASNLMPVFSSSFMMAVCVCLCARVVHLFFTSFCPHLYTEAQHILQWNSFCDATFNLVSYNGHHQIIFCTKYKSRSREKYKSALIKWKKLIAANPKLNPQTKKKEKGIKSTVVSNQYININTKSKLKFAKLKIKQT